MARVVSLRAKRALNRRARIRFPSRALLAVPSFGWTAAFFLAPLVILVVYSFAQIDIVTFKLRFGWTVQNYVRIVEGLYLHTIVRSVLLSIGATLICLVVAFPVAYFISRQPAGRQQTLLLGVMVPFWTSFLIRTYAWVNLLGNGGPIEDVGRKLRLVHGSLDVLYSPVAVGIGIVYGYLPLMILPLYVALERIDPELEEAAADLGAPGRRIFRRVVLPLATPGIVAGCIMVGIPALGEYVVPAILGGNKTLMYGNVVANQFLNVGDWPFGSALAASLMALMTIFLLVARGRLMPTEQAA